MYNLNIEPPEPSCENALYNVHKHSWNVEMERTNKINASLTYPEWMRSIGENMKRSIMFSILVSLAVFGTVVANIMSSLVAPFYLGPFYLSGGFYTFPLMYIASDLLSKCYGYKASRQVAWIALGANILMILIVELGYYTLPGAQEALTPLHMSAFMITFAGLLGAQVGDWVNDIVFQKLPKNKFYVQSIGSSLVGQIVDSTIFVALGLAMVWKIPVEAAIVNIGSQVIFKVLVETVLFPVTYTLQKKIGISEYEESKVGGIFG